MTLGELRSATRDLPDSTPVFLCDDQKYPKWVSEAYQPVVVHIGPGNDEYELYIEHSEIGT